MANKVIPVETPGGYVGTRGKSLIASGSRAALTPSQYSKAWSIQGFDEIIKNLNIEIMRITQGGKEGLLQVAKEIRRDMVITAPTIPVDKGNLINSWSASPVKDSVGNNGVLMGFSANYALWVHEMIEPINWTQSDKSPAPGAKFFQAAINRNRETILQILADHTKVK